MTIALRPTSHSMQLLTLFEEHRFQQLRSLCESRIGCLGKVQNFCFSAKAAVKDYTSRRFWIGDNRFIVSYQNFSVPGSPSWKELHQILQESI